jgi:RpiB/LacA/LacB family sugar-phosphate isomerase
MRIGLAADHAGFELKQNLAEHLAAADRQIVDLGAQQYQQDDDYPDYAKAIGEAIQRKYIDRGILICGSGVGASIAANKLAGVRAGLCHDTYSAHQGVEHDDMNVLVLGSRIVGIELAYELVKAFVTARFSGEDRHLRRLEKVKALEKYPTS